MNDYVLSVGKKGKKRLDVVNLLYGKNSEFFLKKSGLKKGMYVLDFGCGIGHMTRFISKIVGDKGKVFAIDNSFEQLEIAKNLSAAEKYKNINFIQADICSDQIILNTKVDLAYGRLILTHTSNPTIALTNICNMLNKGSVLAVEEPITSESFCLPQNKWFDLHLKLYSDLGRLAGRDYDTGNKLHDMCHKQGLDLEEIHYYQSLFRKSDLKKIALLRTTECKEKYLAQNLIDLSSIEELLKELESITYDNNFIFGGVKMCQVIGRLNQLSGE